MTEQELRAWSRPDIVAEIDLRAAQAEIEFLKAVIRSLEGHRKACPFCEYVTGQHASSCPIPAATNVTFNATVEQEESDVEHRVNQER